MSPDTWFSVDCKGLAKLMEGRSKAFVLYELLQNAWDQNVQKVDITFEYLGYNKAQLLVEDDDPDGFRDLADAYTLFAESYKKADPTKRGRFNLGEKLVLALCTEAEVSTTKGIIRFHPDGTRSQSRSGRKSGSIVRCLLKISKDDFNEIVQSIDQLLPPDGIDTAFNGKTLSYRQPIHHFSAQLDTVISDAEGVLRHTKRNTTVEVFEVLPDETASIYEMGIPVVETGDKYHINVEQKVPLNSDRDNVTPSYLRTLRVLVLNEMHTKLQSAEEANANWAREATSDPRCEPTAIEKCMDLRFGEKRVAYDPSDPEANNRAVSEGFSVVHGRNLSSTEWDNVRVAKAIPSAGSMFPTAKPYSDDPNAPPVKVIPEDEWTSGMKAIAAYAKYLAKEIMGVTLTVRIVHTTNRFVAAYGHDKLDFNLLKLGKKFFAQGATQKVDALLIHEFGHHYSSNHLSEEYYDGLCKIGADLKQLAMKQSEHLQKISDPSSYEKKDTSHE